jgi:hypothetical protein
MHPIVFFVIILFVIWVLSSIASAISKQQDAARRRQVRLDVDPARRTRPPQMQQQQRQLNPAYQVRHPEMLASRPQPARRAITPAQPSTAAQRQQQRRQRPPRRAATVLPPPPIPAMQGAQRAAAATVPAKVAAVAARPVSTEAVKAPAIARWLNPATLRQQFILTEVFQPPLGLREERIG